MLLCTCQFPDANLGSSFVYINLNCKCQLADASFLMLVSTTSYHMPFCTNYFAHLSLHILLYICQLVDVRLSIRVCTCHFFYTAYRCLLANAILQMLICQCYYSKKVCKCLFADDSLWILLCGWQFANSMWQCQVKMSGKSVRWKFQQKMLG